MSLEGGKAKDSIRNSDQGDGLVHLAIDELFRLIHQKAAAVGACSRRDHGPEQHRLWVCTAVVLGFLPVL